LPGKAAFGRVFANAARSRDAFFTVLYCSNGEKFGRLGLAIAKKNCRLAVGRNRLKRIVREAFRLYQGDLVGLDIVVMNRPGAASASKQRLFDSLASHWRKCRSASSRRQEK
jgi:ribonuclease P protein component